MNKAQTSFLHVSQNIPTNSPLEVKMDQPIRSQIHISLLADPDPGSKKSAGEKKMLMQTSNGKHYTGVCFSNFSQYVGKNQSQSIYHLNFFCKFKFSALFGQ